MKTQGFSTIETLLVLTVTVLIGGAIFTFQRDIFSWNQLLTNSLVGQDEARRAFKTMSAEIRSMAPSATGAYPLVQVTANSLTFYVNLDSDTPTERVRYFITGTTLKRGVIEPSGSPLAYTAAETVSELVHGLTNTTNLFSYYNSAYAGTGAALATPIDVAVVRLIKVEATTDLDPSRPPSPLTLTTQVSLRNLKDNL